MMTKESEVFEFLYRARDHFRAVRPDTYFAILKENQKKVFVKGPLFETFSPETFSDIQKIKKVLNLKVITYKILSLIPDGEVINGSYRSLINCINKEYYFIYCDCIDGSFINSAVRKSEEFKKIVAFRELVGIGDTKVDDNFLVHGENIYSIDEDAYFNPFVSLSLKSHKLLLILNMKKKLEELELTEKTKQFLKRQFI
jgi:hypothetical protein